MMTPAVLYSFPLLFSTLFMMTGEQTSQNWFYRSTKNFLSWFIVHLMSNLTPLIGITNTVWAIYIHYSAAENTFRLVAILYAI